MKAVETPTAHTPEGGWKGEMPPPILAACTEPLAAGAPDLRGLWKAFAVEINGTPSVEPADHVERIEQCSNRVVITADGVIHDMRADGTLENGVNDVSGVTGSAIRVAAIFEDGALVLHPNGVGKSPITVTCHLEGDVLVWKFGPNRVTRMRRTD
ncbi:MAG: hypothetical protein IH863_05725 [Chloroflexi bacterium]|nr:hypothetical protein [Chloroflexota bacterium]